MKRLLLVGWDAADWKIIDPLIAKGEMPHLARLISEGVRGNMATIYPALSPMLWTSIATGKRPNKHGIHGFTEPMPDGLSIRPVSSLGRKTKAFWNILNQNGKRSVVVGWWPSHPAEPIRGAMVSDRFPLETSQDPATPLPPGCVWPAEREADLAELRLHAIDISGDMLRTFVPRFSEVDQTKDKSLHDLAGLVAETLTVHAAATELIETEEWDVAAIYYVGIDHFSHRFMRNFTGRAKLREDISDPAIFADVVPNVYRWHDVMLGRLLDLAGEDCGVMLLSDHGFHSDFLLPDYMPPEAAGPAVEHRHFGIFCMRAPGVHRGKEIYGATVLDLAPTLLQLCGIPPGADMDGKVLLNAFENPRRLEPIPSWDDVPGEDGGHESWRQYDSKSAVEALEQLVNLGYIAPPGADAAETVARCVEENRYNLARAYLDAGMPREAALVAEELIAREPEEGRYYIHVFECWFSIRDLDACREVLDRFDAVCEKFMQPSKEALERIQSECPDEQIPMDVMGRKSPAELVKRAKLAQKSQGFGFQRLVARARLMLAEATTPELKEEAGEFLKQFETIAEDNLDLQMFLAMGFATAGDFSHALEYTHGVRRADPDRFQAMALEARIYQAMGKHQECVESALDSLALVYFNPLLHHHMAISLLHLGEEEKAEHSFRVALSQMPGLVDAHLELARILRKNPARAGDAGWHQAQANLLSAQAKQPREAVSTEEDFAAAGAEAQGFDRWDGTPPADRTRVITIVAGLPRSGTSMMMQLLNAAGIEPYTDGVRTPDEDNPRGYFEHERATRVHEDSSWLAEARGKVVKIVGQLLPRLPATEEYRIVFMHRNLDEVVASQTAMLDRLGRKAHRSAEELAQVYAGQLVRIQQWLQRAPAVQAMSVNYADALSDPAGTAARLAKFLGEPFDAARAAEAIEPSLRRQSVADSLA